MLLVLRDVIELVLRVAVEPVLRCGWRATVVLLVERVVALLLAEPELLPVERLAVTVVVRVVVVADVVRAVACEPVLRVVTDVERVALSARPVACALVERIVACERATAVFVLPYVRLTADWRFSSER